jgi:hypothetical protein
VVVGAIVEFTGRFCELVVDNFRDNSPKKNDGTSRGREFSRAGDWRVSRQERGLESENRRRHFEAGQTWQDEMVGRGLEHRQDEVERAIQGATECAVAVASPFITPL